MGSEQSNQGNQNAIPQRQESLSQYSRQSAMRRHHSGKDSQNGLDSNELGRPGSISPGPSICSDSDLPYISYTVNRPIGDSPKLPNKHLSKEKNAPQRKVTKQSSLKNIKSNAHNIVVVKSGSTGPTIDKDTEILRLQNIPMFLPIMRGTLNLPAVRDPEVLERLDPTPFKNLCLRYQAHLSNCTNIVATEQNMLTQKIREADIDIMKIIACATRKQKRYAKYAEKLQNVYDVSRILTRCHTMLNQTLESMETLNNMLSIEDRLEPFVWTTG